MSELDGSLIDPVYIKGLEETGVRQNMNTFPFALGAAGMQVNLALRYLLGKDWWPELSRQEYQFTKGVVTRTDEHCEAGCSFRRLIATGDKSHPPYLRSKDYDTGEKTNRFNLKGVGMEWWSKLLQVLSGRGDEVTRK